MSPNVNHAWFVHFVQDLPNWRQLRVLDFGCGVGEVVELLREAGVEAYGCDVFYEGAQTSEGPAADRIRGLVERGWLRAIDEESDLPYPPGHFDVIVSNQVLEHVADLRGTLRRLDRVLVDDGVMCLHFPLLDGLREGHIGIPLAHWFQRGSPLRRRYTLALRRLGLGSHKSDLTPEAWTDFHLDWIDRYCHYRSYHEVRALLAPSYEVRHNERAYVRFRTKSRVMRALATVPGTEGLWAGVFRRVGSTMLLVRKKRE